jgi:hypothetical protein
MMGVKAQLLPIYPRIVIFSSSVFPPLFGQSAQQAFHLLLESVSGIIMLWNPLYESFSAAHFQVLFPYGSQF